MLFFDDFSTKKRIGKKAKTGRGRGGDDGGGRVRGRKKGGEGEEIWGAKREAHAKSRLGTELDYYNGLGRTRALCAHNFDFHLFTISSHLPWSINILTFMTTLCSIFFLIFNILS